MELGKVPRDIPGLKQLSRAQRSLVLELLEGMLKLEPNPKGFRALDDNKQCDVLHDLLALADRKGPSGFIAIGIPLPLRVKRQETNRRRWEDFADQAETVLNSLTTEGYSRIDHLKFEGHGMLILGQRPPEPQVLEMPEALKSLLAIKLGITPPEAASKEDYKLGEIITKIQEGLTPLSTNEEFKESAFEVLKSIEDKEAFRVHVKNEQEKHSKTCPSSGCVLDRIFQAVLDALDEHDKNLC